MWGGMGTKTLNNTFGTGYVQRLAYLVAYLDNEGKLHIKKGAVIVPWYTNSTDEYSYSLALGEEGKRLCLCKRRGRIDNTRRPDNIGVAFA